MKKGIEIFDYFFLLRPTLFYPIWTFFLAGVWGGKRFGIGAPDFTHSMGLLWVALGLSLIMGGVFVLNQIQDIETDKANGKLFLLANGIIPVREAYWEAALMTISGLGLGLWIDIRVGLGFLILLILSGWLYNYPPMRWKDKPVMGIVTNATGGLVIYCLGWMSGGGEGLIPLRVTAYTLAGAAVFLNTTLPDIDGDAKTDKITFGVRYGLEKTALWALILEAITISLAFLFRDWLLFIPGLIVFPLFIVGCVNRTMVDVLRATKFSVLALAVAICIFSPWYLLPVVFVFFFSKWYYKKRFNFDYPSFRSS